MILWLSCCKFPYYWFGNLLKFRRQKRNGQHQQRTQRNKRMDLVSHVMLSAFFIAMRKVFRYFRILLCFYYNTVGAQAQKQIKMHKL